MFWCILAFLVFSGTLKSEWVELPKLDPWSVEKPLDKHFIPVDSRIHLSSHKTVKPSLDESHVGVSTLPADSTLWDGILEMEDGLVQNAHTPDTVIHLQAPAYLTPMIDQGNKSITQVDLTTLKRYGDLRTTANRPTHSKPNKTLPEATVLTKEPKEKPSKPPPDGIPTPHPDDYHPNRTYTYLDPLIESLMLKVHQTLISQAGQPIRQKIHYLQSLQNNLLNQIWKRSQRLWVIEGSEARGHEMMTFPSLEGALLTISFLTFAVFLIKIVKQFIQGMQGQNATMIEVPIPNRRHRRDAFATQSELILKMIEEFHLQHALH